MKAAQSTQTLFLRLFHRPSRKYLELVIKRTQLSLNYFGPPARTWIYCWTRVPDGDHPTKYQDTSRYYLSVARVQPSSFCHPFASHSNLNDIWESHTAPLLRLSYYCVGTALRPLSKMNCLRMTMDSICNVHNPRLILIPQTENGNYTEVSLPVYSCLIMDSLNVVREFQ